MRIEDFNELKEAFRKAVIAFAIFEGHLNRIEHEFQNQELLKAGFDPFIHDVGTWVCKESPIGVCIYHEDDGARDECVVCGHPDERK